MLGSVLVFQEYFIKKSVNKDHSTLFSVTTTKLYVSFKEITILGRCLVTSTSLDCTSIPQNKLVRRQQQLVFDTNKGIKMTNQI
jgi:hypothetical protein